MIFGTSCPPGSTLTAGPTKHGGGAGTDNKISCVKTISLSGGTGDGGSSGTPTLNSVSANPSQIAPGDSVTFESVGSSPNGN